MATDVLSSVEAKRAEQVRLHQDALSQCFARVYRFAMDVQKINPEQQTFKRRIAENSLLDGVGQMVRQLELAVHGLKQQQLHECFTHVQETQAQGASQKEAPNLLDKLVRLNGELSELGREICPQDGRWVKLRKMYDACHHVVSIYDPERQAGMLSTMRWATLGGGEFAVGSGGMDLPTSSSSKGGRSLFDWTIGGAASSNSAAGGAVGGAPGSGGSTSSGRGNNYTGSGAMGVLGGDAGNYRGASSASSSRSSSGVVGPFSRNDADPRGRHHGATSARGGGSSSGPSSTSMPGVGTGNPNRRRRRSTFFSSQTARSQTRMVEVQVRNYQLQAARRKFATVQRKLCDRWLSPFGQSRPVSQHVQALLFPTITSDLLPHLLYKIYLDGKLDRSQTDSSVQMTNSEKLAYLCNLEFLVRNIEELCRSTSIKRGGELMAASSSEGDNLVAVACDILDKQRHRVEELLGVVDVEGAPSSSSAQALEKKSSPTLRLAHLRERIRDFSLFLLEVSQTRATQIESVALEQLCEMLRIADGNAASADVEFSRKLFQDQEKNRRADALANLYDIADVVDMKKGGVVLEENAPAGSSSHQQQQDQDRQAHTPSSKSKSKQDLCGEQILAEKLNSLSPQKVKNEIKAICQVLETWLSSSGGAATGATSAEQVRLRQELQAVLDHAEKLMKSSSSGSAASAHICPAEIIPSLLFFIYDIAREGQPTEADVGSVLAELFEECLVLRDKVGDDDPDATSWLEKAEKNFLFTVENEIFTGRRENWAESIKQNLFPPRVVVGGGTRRKSGTLSSPSIKNADCSDRAAIDFTTGSSSSSKNSGAAAARKLWLSREARAFLSSLSQAEKGSLFDRVCELNEGLQRTIQRKEADQLQKKELQQNVRNLISENERLRDRLKTDLVGAAKKIMTPAASTTGGSGDAAAEAVQKGKPTEGTVSVEGDVIDLEALEAADSTTKVVTFLSKLEASEARLLGLVAKQEQQRKNSMDRLESSPELTSETITADPDGDDNENAIELMGLLLDSNEALERRIRTLSRELLSDTSLSEPSKHDNISKKLEKDTRKQRLQTVLKSVERGVPSAKWKLEELAAASRSTELSSAAPSGSASVLSSSATSSRDSALSSVSGSCRDCGSSVSTAPRLSDTYAYQHGGGRSTSKMDAVVGRETRLDEVEELLDDEVRETDKRERLSMEQKADKLFGGVDTVYLLVEEDTSSSDNSAPASSFTGSCFNGAYRKIGRDSEQGRNEFYDAFPATTEEPFREELLHLLRYESEAVASGAGDCGPAFLAITRRAALSQSCDEGSFSSSSTVPSASSSNTKSPGTDEEPEIIWRLWRRRKGRDSSSSSSSSVSAPAPTAEVEYLESLDASDRDDDGPIAAQPLSAEEAEVVAQSIRFRTGDNIMSSTTSCTRVDFFRSETAFQHARRSREHFREVDSQVSRVYLWVSSNSSDLSKRFSGVYAKGNHPMFPYVLALEESDTSLKAKNWTAEEAATRAVGLVPHFCKQSGHLRWFLAEIDPVNGYRPDLCNQPRVCSFVDTPVSARNGFVLWLDVDNEKLGQARLALAGGREDRSKLSFAGDQRWTLMQQYYGVDGLFPEFADEANLQHLDDFLASSATATASSSGAPSAAIVAAAKGGKSHPVYTPFVTYDEREFYDLYEISVGVFTDESDWLMCMQSFESEPVCSTRLVQKRFPQRSQRKNKRRRGTGAGGEAAGTSAKDASSARTAVGTRPTGTRSASAAASSSSGMIGSQHITSSGSSLSVAAAESLHVDQGNPNEGCDRAQASKAERRCCSLTGVARKTSTADGRGSPDTLLNRVANLFSPPSRITATTSSSRMEDIPLDLVDDRDQDARLSRRAEQDALIRRTEVPTRKSKRIKAGAGELQAARRERSSRRPRRGTGAVAGILEQRHRRKAGGDANALGDGRDMVAGSRNQSAGAERRARSRSPRSCSHSYTPKSTSTTMSSEGILISAALLDGGEDDEEQVMTRTNSAAGPEDSTAPSEDVGDKIPLPRNQQAEASLEPETADEADGERGSEKDENTEARSAAPTLPETTKTEPVRRPKEPIKPVFKNPFDRILGYKATELFPELTFDKVEVRIGVRRRALFKFNGVYKRVKLMTGGGSSSSSSFPAPPPPPAAHPQQEQQNASDARQNLPIFVHETYREVHRELHKGCQIESVLALFPFYGTCKNDKIGWYLSEVKMRRPLDGEDVLAAGTRTSSSRASNRFSSMPFLPYTPNIRKQPTLANLKGSMCSEDSQYFFLLENVAFEGTQDWYSIQQHWDSRGDLLGVGAGAAAGAGAGGTTSSSESNKDNKVKLPKKGQYCYEKVVESAEEAPREERKKALSLREMMGFVTPGWVRVDVRPLTGAA